MWKSIFKSMSFEGASKKLLREVALVAAVACLLRESSTFPVVLLESGRRSTALHAYRVLAVAQEPSEGEYSQRGTG